MKTIKDLPEHSRPREKLRERGAAALSDEELVAAILGMGTAGVDVRTIARQVTALLREQRADLTLDALLQVPGVGLAKASQILSALELARRYLMRDTARVATAADVLPLLADIAGKQQEYFVCISLNGAHEVIETRVVTIGLLDGSPIHPREVYANVLADRAAAVIFAHNHPSGDVQPSDADLRTHEQLANASTSMNDCRIPNHGQLGLSLAIATRSCRAMWRLSGALAQTAASSVSCASKVAPT
jgi:DNA repair protein RadC